MAISPEATLVKPELDPAFFYKWNADEEKWEAEAKPTKVEDFLGVRVSHTDQTPHCCELRQLMQLFAEQSADYRIIRGPEEEGLWWGVEKIPEKTEVEKKEERISELKGKLSASDYVVTKIAEGVASQDDYAEVLSDRKAWRAEINQLEAEIVALKE